MFWGVFCLWGCSEGPGHSCPFENILSKSLSCYVTRDHSNSRHIIPIMVTIFNIQRERCSEFFLECLEGVRYMGKLLRHFSIDYNTFVLKRKFAF